MGHKIVMDSAGDLQGFTGVDFVCVPLKILAGEKEFVDDPTVDVTEMVAYLKQYKGKATTACPGVGEYLDAFGDAEHVYCITITGTLSGSYNAAAVAARAYQEQHPERKVHVFDSLSTGPEMVLLAEKVRELLHQGSSFDEIVRRVTEYHERTRLIFSLESLHNLVNNGRVPAAVAKVVGILGIRLLGRASEEGRLEPMAKARGENKVVPELMKHMISMGYNGGRVHIAHCENQAGAEKLCQMLLEHFPGGKITLGVTGALCSFYAEQGGLLVGFET